MILLIIVLMISLVILYSLLGHDYIKELRGKNRPCVNCRYSRKDTYTFYGLSCTYRVENPISYNTDMGVLYGTKGRPYNNDTETACFYMRKSYNDCGIEGKLYDPKTSQEKGEE